MRSLGKKITCLILALAMVFALTPVLTGPAYADADMVYLPAGEVMASSLEAGHNYYADSAGTTIILEADDDVTVDFIGPRSTSSTLTI